MVGKHPREWLQQLLTLDHSVEHRLISEFWLVLSLRFHVEVIEAKKFSYDNMTIA